MKNIKAGLDEPDPDDSEAEEHITEKERAQRPSDQWVALQPFKDIYKDSPICRMMFEYGPACTPLCAIGMTMNFIGNHLLHYIHTIMRRRVFYPCH